MRIVYLHQYFKTPDMAGGTRSYEMARRLVARGHEVHIVTAWTQHKKGRSGWFTEIIDGIHVHWLPVAYSNKMSFYSRLKSFFHFAVYAAHKAASIPADVILASSTPLTISLPGAYASWKSKIPMVFEVRDVWPAVPIALGIIKNKWLVKAANYLEKFAYKRSERIIALAPGMADSIINLGVERKNIAIIPNGCDFELFKNATVKTATSKQNNEVIILYTGTIGPVNGVEYIAKLAKALINYDQAVNIKFLIVGDGKNFKNVYSLAEELGVLNVNFFMVGELSKKEVSKIMEKACATIVTYNGPELLYRDSVSNKFFDSIASGKLVFANFNGFSTLIAKNVGAAVILSNTDFHAAACSVLKYVRDLEFLEQARISGLKLAYDFFNRDMLAKKLELVLLQAINGKYSEDNIQIGAEYRELWTDAMKIS